MANGMNIAIMPSGSPAPSVLIEAEAIKFLRIEDYSHPELTLRYYRQTGKLRAVRIGKELRYTACELMRFLERQAGGNNG